MNMFISPDFGKINNMLMDPQCIMDSGAPQCLLTPHWCSVAPSDPKAASPNSRSSHPTAKTPRPCPMQGVMPPGSFILGAGFLQ